VFKHIYVFILFCASLYAGGLEDEALPPQSYMNNYLKILGQGNKNAAEELPKIRAAWFELCKKEGQVQTKWQDKGLKASKLYRKLTFELLTQYSQKRDNIIANMKLNREGGYNLKHPEKVLLVNGKPYCAGPVHIDTVKFRGIQFEEKLAEEELFGQTRLGLLHEITHLSEKDYYVSKERQQNIRLQQPFELRADKVALLIGNCFDCAYEMAQEYFDPYKQQFLLANALKKDSRLAIEKALQMSDDEFAKSLKQAHESSLIVNSTHPQNIERALTAIEFCRKNPKAQCTYHQKYGRNIKTKDMLKMHEDDIRVQKEKQRQEQKAQQEAKAKQPAPQNPNQIKPLVPKPAIVKKPPLIKQSTLDCSSAKKIPFLNLGIGLGFLASIWGYRSWFKKN
jgi:hypothetical protein